MSGTAAGSGGSRLFAAKVATARAIGALSRRSGRGGGTTLPGRVLLRTAPDAIRRLGAGLTGERTVISATNGKTTTAGMLASALRAAGRDPVHNRAGSNMAWGVATALLEGHGEEGLFEVDEAWLPQVVDELSPTLLVLGNLFRDQLDRYGELERLADEWAEMIALREGTTGLVLNADDPLIADLGRDRDLRRRAGVTFFGIEDPAQAVPELQHAFDAKHCRRCGAPYRYERAFVGHLGHYTCPNCGADRPAPDVYATDIELRGITGSAFRAHTPWGELAIELPLPGLYNVYNALAAIAAAGRLGIPPELIRSGLDSVQAAFGRVETIAIGSGSLSILLIKNPAGANEVLRTLQLEAERNRIRARPLDRPQRPDRRRPRRLLDLGRGLRVARRLGPTRLVHGDPRGRDRAAAQVRGLAGRADRGRRGHRPVPRSGAGGIGGPAVRVADLYGADRAADAAVEARAGRGVLAMSAARPSARSAPAALTEAVIWHDVENGGYAADLRLWESLARRAPRGRGRPRRRHRPGGAAPGRLGSPGDGRRRRPGPARGPRVASGRPWARDRDGRAATSARWSCATPTR